jgi:hypothetical protein
VKSCVHLCLKFGFIQDFVRPFEIAGIFGFEYGAKESWQMADFGFEATLHRTSDKTEFDLNAVQIRVNFQKQW